MSYYSPRFNEICISSHTPTCETRIYMNLICCVCNKEITGDVKIAKIISIKRIQHDGTNARIEYQTDQEEIYCHLSCLVSISCPAINNENFNHTDFSIIDQRDTNLDIVKNEESLVRNNLLGFLNE